MLQPWITLDKFDKGDDNDQLNWMLLLNNPHPLAISLLRRSNPDCLLSAITDSSHLASGVLSSNPSNASIDILIACPDLIHWGIFAGNCNEHAMKFLRRKIRSTSNPSGVYFSAWSNLFRNPCDDAVDISLQQVVAIPLATTLPPTTTACEYTNNNNCILISVLHQLSRNTNDRMVQWLTLHPWCIELNYLSGNSSHAAIDWLEAHPETISWSWICQNTNERAMRLLWNRLQQQEEEQGQQLDLNWMNWKELSKNPSDGAMRILNQYPQHINWTFFIYNEHHAAIDRIERQLTIDPTTITWSALCRNRNPRILSILESHPDKIYWPELLCNPIIFRWYDPHLCKLFGDRAADYRPFLHNRLVQSGLANELMANRFHPQHMDKWVSWGHEEETDFI